MPRAKYRAPNCPIRLDVATWPGAELHTPDKPGDGPWRERTAIIVGKYDLVAIDGEPFVRGEMPIFFARLWGEGTVLTVQEIIRDPREPWLIRMAVRVGAPLLRFRMRQGLPPNHGTWYADPVE